MLGFGVWPKKMGQKKKQRYMLIRQSLIRPCARIHGAGIPRHTMITNKNENGIVEIIFFLRSFHKFPEAIIRIPEGVEFLYRFKTITRQLFIRQFLLHKIRIVRRYHVGTMIVGGLDDRKERSRLFSELIVCFKKKILIADAPNI